MSQVGESHTATFLMTDIAGSTRLWEEQRNAMVDALAAHDAMLRSAVEEAGGTVVKTTGDGLLAAFERPGAAVRAALAGQRDLQEHDWPTTTPLRVRMAIHSGNAEVRDDDYFGPSLNRVARLLAIGHGGQVLVSASGAALVADDLPAGAMLVDRGEHHLKDLTRPEHVFQLGAPGLASDFPALRSGTPQTNLPAQLTSFVGRGRELDEVRHLVARQRLVTLIGVGGTGKTRLALEVVDALLDRHADGVWLVELAPIADPGLVPQEVARALGVPDVPGQAPIATVTDYLRGKDLLLVIDNCEHLIDAASDLVTRLLGGARGLRVLATSREGLGVPGEAVFQVPSLGLPEPATGLGDGGDGADAAAMAGAEAVRLFVDRASAVEPDFRLDDATLGPVAEICRRLDGIPLAIELAAARVNVLSAAEIAQGLDDRFRLLAGGRRTAVPRQQTLQALIDWSWDLLTPADRRLLRRLAVFAGGWTLDAAVAVTAEAEVGAGSGARLATLDGLGRLVDRSLVKVDRGAVTRYGMLETIRQYARDWLVAAGEADAVRIRHLAHFHRLAVEAAARLEGPDIVAWLDRLDTDVDNLRSALDWALEKDLTTAIDMTAALAQYWRHRASGPEGSDRLRQAIDAVAALPDPAPVEAPGRAARLSRLFSAASMSAATTNRDSAFSIPWANEAVQLARESDDRRALSEARTTWSLASIIGSGPDDVMAEAQDIYDQAASVERWSAASFLASGIAMFMVIDDERRSDEWLDRAIDAARRSGNPDAMAFVALARGRLLGHGGRLDEARLWFEQAMAGFRGLGDARLELVARSDLTHALRRNGLPADAETELRRTILEWQRYGQRGAIASQLEAFAYVAAATGRARRAAALLGSAERLRDVAGTGRLSFERAEYEAELARLRTALDPAELDSAWAEGRAMSTEEAVVLACSG